MSIYLVAFIVGDRLHHIKSTAFRVPIRIYTAGAEDAERGQFSLDLSVKIMKLFEESLRFENPLPKMDIVAVPSKRGAMENWGLLMFQADALLFDTELGGLNEQQFIANVLAHAIAHQWLSCLVTTKAWDATWLNEGFATWMALFANERLYRDWRV